MKISVRDMCVIAVFVALIAALTQVTIPLPGGVPLTLQTFIISFSAAMLGARRGAVAALVYLLLGAVGLPVFVGFGGGFGRIIGPWGGYLLSYPLVSLIVGHMAEKEGRQHLVMGLALGVIVNLSIGMGQLALVTGQSLGAAFAVGVLPFLLPEVIKMSAVFVLAATVKRALVAQGVSLH